MISVSIPIQILPLFPLLNQTQHLAVILQTQARLHKNTSSCGFLKTLNNLAFEKYRLIKSKFDTIRFFYSDPRNETLQAEADLISRDPEFDFTGHDIEVSEFIANHNNFVESREQLRDLLQEVMQKMTPTTTSTTSTTTRTPGHRHAGRNRSKRSEPKPSSPPHIDPSNYIPKVEKYNNYLATGRSKRQFFGFLASMLAGLGMSSAFGLVNGQKIDHIADALSQTIDRQDLMIAQLEANSKDIQTNRHLISNLADVVSVVSQAVRAEHWKLNGVYLYLLIQTELDKLDSLLDTYTNAISTACQHRLHIGVLTEEGAKGVFRKIHKIAKNNNLVPIINSPAQLSQLPVSWVLTETGVKIIIHCMASSESRTFKLFQYKPFIINMGKSKDQDGPAVFGKIQPKNSILAISSDNRFVELSPYELSLCNKMGDIRFCSQNIFNKPSKTTCLSSLYRADHKSSIELCALSLETASSDQVLEKSPNEFMYFSQQGSNSYSTICQDSNSIGQLTQFSTLNIPVNCHLDTPQYFIYRRDSLSLQIDPQPQLYEWSLPPLDFFENDLDIKDLETAVQKLESFKGVPEITSGSIQKLRQMQRPLVRNYPLLGTMAIAGIALVIVIGLILAICFQAYRHRRALFQSNDPTYRYNELMKDQANVDALLQLVQNRQSHSTTE